MSFTNPSVQDFKDQFARDFPFGTNTQTSITTNDINYAFALTNININPALFSDQTSYSIGYNLLSAHYLVTNIRASSQGINGQYNFLQQSKGVGPVSESFGIPPRILENPFVAMLCKTNYGAMYIQLILPQLTGQMFVVCGGTNP